MITLQEAKHYAELAFELNPPLAESEVVAFETKYQIQLPHEYRAFITKIGNGGMQGGIRPFFQLGKGGRYERIIPFITQPFPFTIGQHNIPYNETLLYGLLPFFDEGCGIHHAVVVTGAERGNVWVIDFTNSDFIIPLGDYYPVPMYSGKRVTFFEWFKWYDDLATLLGE